MKGILSRMTPRALFVLAVITELLLGATYIGVILSRDTGLVLSLILQYTYELLHIVCLLIGLSVALRCTEGRQLWHGCGYLAALIATLYVKDYLANAYSLSIEGGYLVGDALLLSLSATALNTLLITGLFCCLVYSLSYLFFYYRRPETAPPQDIWSLSSPALASACLIAALAAIPDLIATFVNQILFLVKDAMWMPTPSEIVTMVLDLLLPPLFAVLAYLTVYMTVRYGKQPADKRPDLDESASSIIDTKE